MGPKNMTTAEFMALSNAGKARAWWAAAREQDHESDYWDLEARKAEAAAETARRRQREAEINQRQCMRNAAHYDDLDHGEVRQPERCDDPASPVDPRD